MQPSRATATRTRGGDGKLPRTSHGRRGNDTTTATTATTTTTTTATTKAKATQVEQTSLATRVSSPDAWADALLQLHDKNNNNNTTTAAASDEARKRQLQRLLPHAYRLHLSCSRHDDDGDDNRTQRAHADDTTSTAASDALTRTVAAHAGCAATTACRAGLLSLDSTHSRVRQACVEMLMGSGPAVVLHSSDDTSTRTRSATHDDGNDDDDDDDTDDAAAAMATLRAVDALPRVCLWRGIGNLGNTCYLACVLQLLFAIAPLRRAVLADAEAVSQSNVNNDNDSDGDGDGENGCRVAASSSSPSSLSSPLCASQLKEVMAAMAYSRGGRGADATAFARYLHLDVQLQQDAQEFMLLLLDWLRSHGSRQLACAVNRTLACTLLFTRTCAQCGYTTQRAQLFYSLSLPLRATLRESLDAFVLPDTVDGVTCEDGCGQRNGVATTRPYVRTLPPVLVLHLNRFVYDTAAQQHRKRTMPVYIPHTLDLYAYVQQWHEAKKQKKSAAAATASSAQQEQQASEQSSSDDEDDDAAATTTTTTTTTQAADTCMYELRGVVQHMGDSAHAGHYTYRGKVGTTTTTATTTARATTTATTTITATPPSSSSFVWLEYNDAEVCDVTAHMTTRATTAASDGANNNSSNNSDADGIVSRDAYVLIYHRLAPARQAPLCDGSARAPHTTTTTVTTTTLNDTDAPPDVCDFPTRLLRDVAAYNTQVLHDRLTWLQRRQTMTTLLRRWAAAATAVFAPTTTTTNTTMTTTTADNDDDNDDARRRVACLPTTWLRAFGRCFLPPYVDVRRLNAAAHDNDDDDNNNTTTLLSWTSAAATTTTTTSVAAGGLTVLLDGVQRYMALRRSNALLCAHGKLAPWAAYKTLPAAAVTSLCAFLTQCVATTTTNNNSRSNNSNSSTTHAEMTGGAAAAASALRPASLFTLDTHADLCATCALHCARAVQWLRDVDASDTAMTRLVPLPQVVAARKRALDTHTATQNEQHEHDNDNDNDDDGDKASSVDDRARVATVATTRLRSDGSGHAADTTGVLVSDEVVSAWHAYMASKRAHDAVRHSAGYTGLLALWRADAIEQQQQQALSSLSTTSTWCGDAGVAGDGSHRGGDDGSMQSSSTTNTTTTPLHIVAACADEAMPVAGMRALQPLLAQLPASPPSTAAAQAADARATTTAAGGGSSSHTTLLRDRLLCPHGVLRSEATVHVVHERVRLYLRKRLATLLTAVRAHYARTTPPSSSSSSVSVAPDRTSNNSNVSDDDGSARVDEAAVEHWLLPYIAASSVVSCNNNNNDVNNNNTSSSGARRVVCDVCVSRVIEATAARHRARLRRMTDARRFRTLWLAGQFTSRDATAAMLRAETPATTTTTTAATQVQARKTTATAAAATAKTAKTTTTTTATAVVIDTEERLLQARHPNSDFFRRPIAQTYREALREWQDGHDRVVAQQQRVVAQLRRVVEQQRALSLPIRTVTRRGRGGGGGGGKNNKSNNNNSKAMHVDAAPPPPPPPPDPQSPEGRLEAAERVLRGMRDAPAPAFEERYGCLPTWWVARWYRYVTHNAASPRGNSSNNNNNDSHHQQHDNDNDDNNDDNDAPPRLHTFAPFICPHGKVRVAVSWLNPCDGFWQGDGSRRVEQLWTAHTHNDSDRHTTADTTDGNTATTVAASAPRAACAFVSQAADAHARAWSPPLLVVPMTEYVRILRHYGAPDMVVATRASTARGAVSSIHAQQQQQQQQEQQQQQQQKQHDDNKDSNDAAGDSDSDGEAADMTYACAADKVLCVVQREGALSLSPPTCEECCNALLAHATTRSVHFTYGALQLQLHLRKSKRQFYDATSTLTSSSREGDACGVHYHTTLAQLRALIAAHVHHVHGYLVADAQQLRITRTRNRPLVRVKRSDDNNNNNDDSNKDAHDVEAATLFELGVRDGDMLVVSLLDAVAVSCETAATAMTSSPAMTALHTRVRHNNNSAAANDEEWEAIPPELLLQPSEQPPQQQQQQLPTLSSVLAQSSSRQAASRRSRRGASAAAQRAFAQTRLCSGHVVHDDAASQPHDHAHNNHHNNTGSSSNNDDGDAAVGVACPTCTYLNAAGMVVCEMCETPLTQRA